MARWKRKNRHIVAESTFFTLKEDIVELPEGNEKTYTMLDIPDISGILPVFNDQFILVKNYRYPVDKKNLEIPAGLIDKGEKPIEAAERELEEETGFLLNDAEKLCEYNPIASLNDQKAYLFLGAVKEGGSKDLDAGEDMEVVSLSVDEVYNRLREKKISHPHTMIALFYAKKRIQDHKK